MPRPGEMQRAAQKFIVFEQFQKLNTQSVRQALKEGELAWLENLQPIAPNNLATVPGPARAALATLAESASVMFYAFMNGTDNLVVFTSAGAGFTVNLATGAIGQFAFLKGLANDLRVELLELLEHCELAGGALGLAGRHGYLATRRWKTRLYTLGMRTPPAPMMMRGTRAL